MKTRYQIALWILLGAAFVILVSVGGAAIIIAYGLEPLVKGVP